MVDDKVKIEKRHKRFGDSINERLKLASSVQTYSAYLLVKISYERIWGVKLQPHENNIKPVEDAEQEG